MKKNQYVEYALSNAIKFVRKHGADKEALKKDIEDYFTQYSFTQEVLDPEEFFPILFCGISEMTGLVINATLFMDKGLGIPVPIKLEECTGMNFSGEGLEDYMYYKKMMELKKEIPRNEEELEIYIDLSRGFSINVMTDDSGEFKGVDITKNGEFVSSFTVREMEDEEEDTNIH